MILIAFQFMNEAGNVMLQIACTLFFLKQGIEPKTATYYICIIASPEAFMFFWGIFAETVSIYGKRGHIILAACIQIAFSVLICLHHFDNVQNTADYREIYWFIGFATMVVVGKAWMAPAIEGLAVVQMKLDPLRGAEDIENFGLLAQFVGSIVYCIVAGYVMTLEDTTGHIMPKLFFYFNAAVGLLILIAALLYFFNC
jgi:hypothetical protein